MKKASPKFENKYYKSKQIKERINASRILGIGYLLGLGVKDKSMFIETVEQGQDGLTGRALLRYRLWQIVRVSSSF